MSMSCRRRTRLKIMENLRREMIEIFSGTKHLLTYGRTARMGKKAKQM